MFHYEPSTWIKNNFWRIIFLNALLGFLLISYVVKKEGKKIYYSLVHEKLKIFKQVIKLLFILAIFHFILKAIFPYQSEKIIEQINILNTNKQNFWFLARIVFGLCFLAPLFEECIYRYLIFRIFGRRNPLSYLLSFFTFIFAHYCWHGENIAVLFLQYSMATLGFIYIYKKSGWKLLSPILLHSLVNFLLIGIVMVNPNCSLI